MVERNEDLWISIVARSLLGSLFCWGESKHWALCWGGRSLEYNDEQDILLPSIVSEANATKHGKVAL